MKRLQGDVHLSRTVFSSEDVVRMITELYDTSLKDITQTAESLLDLQEQRIYGKQLTVTD